MANRFIRLIEEGKIASEGELKSAFRALARATHPDLGVGVARGDGFIRARNAYEQAVRYLAPKERGNDQSSVSVPAGQGRYDRALFYADLAALMKAGFPKTARHDKERRKYARLRLRVRSSLSTRDDDETRAPLAAFDAFERSLSDMKESFDNGADIRLESILALLRDIVDYDECGIMPLRASIEIEFAALRFATSDEGVLGFLEILIADMDGGPILG